MRKITELMAAFLPWMDTFAGPSHLLPLPLLRLVWHTQTPAKIGVLNATALRFGPEDLVKTKTSQQPSYLSGLDSGGPPWLSWLFLALFGQYSCSSASPAWLQREPSYLSGLDPGGPPWFSFSCCSRCPASPPDYHENQPTKVDSAPVVPLDFRSALPWVYPLSFHLPFFNGGFCLFVIVLYIVYILHYF